MRWPRYGGHASAALRPATLASQEDAPGSDEARAGTLVGLGPERVEIADLELGAFFVAVLAALELESVVLEICRESYEETIDPELGMILAIIRADDISHGRLVHGDGATYHQVRLSAITYMPVVKELVEGEISEVTDFGAFVRIGCIEALCHISQIADDFFSLSKASLIGRESGNVVRVGDRLRARIITIAIDTIKCCSSSKIQYYKRISIFLFSCNGIT